MIVYVLLELFRPFLFTFYHGTPPLNTYIFGITVCVWNLFQASKMQLKDDKLFYMNFFALEPRTFWKDVCNVGHYRWGCWWLLLVMMLLRMIMLLLMLLMPL